MRLLWSSLSAVLLLLLAAATILYGLLAIMFWEPHRAKPGSVAYLLAIPSAAKNFPILNPCSVPTYSYRFQDGLSPETYWIEYETRLPLAELRTAIDKLATLRQCTPLPKPPADNVHADTQIITLCKMQSRQMQVSVSQRNFQTGDCRAMSILFIEDL